MSDPLEIKYDDTSFRCSSIHYVTKCGNQKGGDDIFVRTLVVIK